MSGERAAAALRGRNDLVAVRREHACGRCVDVAEHHRLHATCENADAPARRTLGRGLGGRLRLERHGTAISIIGRTQPGERQRTPERGEPERPPHPAWIRQRREHHAPLQAVAARPPVLGLDVVARRLDQLVVADSRGAARHARQAAEAAVEVLDDGGVERDGAVELRLDQLDPAARRVHLLAPQQVGRARRQAEAAVDAVGRVLAQHQRSTPAGSSAASRHA